MPLSHRPWAYGSHHGVPDPRDATNQAPPLVGHNVVTSDLRAHRGGAATRLRRVLDDLTALGAEAGTANAASTGCWPTPTTRVVPYDRYGNRVDEVSFHPSGTG